METPSSELRRRVLYTIAVLNAQTPHRGDVHVAAGGLSAPTPPVPTYSAPQRNSQPLPSYEALSKAATSDAQTMRHDHAEPSNPGTGAPALEEGATVKDGLLCHGSDWASDVAYLRAHRDAMQARERELRHRVDAGVGRVNGSRSSFSPLSSPLSSPPPPPPPPSEPAPRRAVRVTGASAHVAAQPFRRIHGDDAPARPLWLHMTSSPSSASTCAPARPIARAAQAPVPMVVPPPDPLAATWERMNQRYEHAYVRQARRLQELQPDLWSRALPSYAALDGMPQLLDNDQSQFISRVRGVVQDDGISYVQ